MCCHIKLLARCEKTSVCYRNLLVRCGEVKRAFWVVSKQPKEITGFGRMKVPAKFKTIEEAKRYSRELNLKKGAYHPGYFVEERIGDTPVSVSKKAVPDEEADS